MIAITVAHAPNVSATRLPRSNRIDVVDALRGFALAGIMLLHNVEQFNFYHEPDRKIQLLSGADPYVWNSLFFVFGGKAYAIFSMLFGFSFWIQFSKMKEKGYDMGGRFLWRMVLLFGFGLVHSIYYSGDLLIFYATFGLGIVAFKNAGNRLVFVVSAFLLLLPLDLVRLARILFESGYIPPPQLSWHYWSQLAAAQGGGTFYELVKADLTSGLTANVLWTLEAGRMFHIPGLFLLGMLAARRKAFTEMPSRKWWVILVGAMAAFVLLFFVNKGLHGWVTNEVLRNQLYGIAGPYSDVVAMLILVSGFILLWRARIGERLFSVLIPYGRMSLTNYTSQALIGIFVYYECGFGLHHYFGATWSLLTGLVLLSMQLVISHWWLNHYKQGPLEMLWRKLMWIGTKAP
jgi:uncharacterized protein